MVKGLPEVRRLLLQRLPKEVVEAADRAIERESTKLARAMNFGAPMLDPPNAIEADWSWGDPGGRGTLKTGRKGRGVTNTASGKLPMRLFSTVYAMGYTSKYPRGTQGFPALARWTEFGTAPRYTKAGQYRGVYLRGKSGRYNGPMPFFFPVWDYEKPGIRRRILAATRNAARLAKKKAGG